MQTAYIIWRHSHVQYVCYSVCVCDYRCVFTGTRTIHEGCECRENGKVQHSYFRLQKFAKHVQGFVNCSRESFLVRREFQKSLKFLANVSSIPRTIDYASEPPCASLANFWSLKYECWNLPSFRHSHPSQIVRVPVKTHLTCMCAVLSCMCVFRSVSLAVLIIFAKLETRFNTHYQIA